MISKLLAIVLAMMSLHVFGQISIDLNPIQDNSIYSESDFSNGLGELYSGLDCDGNIRRALIQFDVEDAIPPGAVITNVSLTLNVSAYDESAADAIYSIHKITRSWGEGTSFGDDDGASPIMPDATWEHAMFSDELWSDLGGDFEGVSSGDQLLTVDTDDFLWTDPQMIEDVENWIADPATNFGWVLIGDEDTDCSIRRIGSKDEGIEPILTIEYECDGGELTAVCRNITIYLDEFGEATIDAEDLDGGSTPSCGVGELTFSASQINFNCEDLGGEIAPPYLVLSAIFDGPLPDGLPKGVELYVTEDIDDLSLYGIGSANNGEGSDGQEFTFPAVTASAGDYIYLANEGVSFEDWFDFAPDYITSAVNINGNDAIELYFDGRVIDVFGDIDVDGSGELWDYEDGWAGRINGTGPDDIVFNAENWNYSGADALDDELTNETAAFPIPIGVFETEAFEGVPVVLTVMDEDANIEECIAYVNVLDTIPPTVTCRGSLDIEIGETGEYNLTVDMVRMGYADACGVLSLSLSQYLYTCADIGEKTVDLTLFDISGNRNTCSTILNITGDDVITISEDEFIESTCEGDGEDGSISVIVEGGRDDFYFYDWDTDGLGDMDDPEMLLGTTAGTYKLVVTDLDGCIDSTTITVGGIEGIEVTSIIVNETCDGSSDGEIDITVTGGVGGYVFDWDNDGLGAFDDTEDIAGLEADRYDVYIKDADGCNGFYTTIVIVDGVVDRTVTVTSEDITANQAGAEYQWLVCPGKTPVDGATEQIFVPTRNDFYAVAINYLGCIDTSECVIYVSSGVEDYDDVNLELYPNPSAGQFTLDINQNFNDALIVVTDMRGGIVLEQMLNDEQTTFDLSHVENGLYFVNLHFDNKLITRKIQKIN
ncbi:T9SS type A sorting domain-containing protein [Crocinitomix catalasitica]|uniref:T9SS type A sorting domain-containing protein n=1 Tax=Crocinitomix catalasitica TaxID=184607 RepID=UPI00048960FC|nr:T9SS type A sorting domain-containing protein [Crocinitomix catalasitica]